MKRKTVSEIVLMLLLMGTLTLTLNTRQAQAQPPLVEWSQTYGWPDPGLGDEAFSVIQTNEGGYAIVGIGFASLVKTDDSGSLQWSALYGLYPESVVQTSDGGFALAGSVPYVGRLVRTDAGGNVQWSQDYVSDPDGVNHLHSLVQTSDGGYAIAGSSRPATGYHHFWMVKTDVGGNVQWNKIYEELGGTAYSLIQTSDGGYAMAGWAGGGAGDSDFYLVKIDMDGNMQWSQTYGSPSWDWAWAVVQTTDGGYALAGYIQTSDEGNWEYWLVKTDPSGNMMWNQKYGGTTWSYAHSLVQTSDGGYVMAGDGFANIVKTDAYGNLQWSASYGGRANSAIQTSDGGFALTGVINGDMWLVKLAGPSQPVQPVGGEWVPADTFSLLAPWISSVLLTAMVTASFVYVKRRKT